MCLDMKSLMKKFVSQLIRVKSFSGLVPIENYSSIG